MNTRWSSNARLSHSSCESLKQCPRRWWFKYERGYPEASGPEAVLGNHAHKVLEDFFGSTGGSREKEDLRTFTSNSFDDFAEKMTTEFPNFRADISELKHDVWNAVEGIFYLETPANVDVIEIEKAFDIEFAGLPLRGFIDRVDQTDDGVSLVDYKGLTLDTPLPTPQGWTTMGEVQVGEEIFGSNGLTTRVLNKSQVHNRPCYKIRFKNGQVIISDNVHLWDVEMTFTTSPRENRIGDEGRQILSTEQMYAMKEAGQNLRIEVASPVKLEDQDLPIPPYTLGAWLGDGSSKTGEVCSGDPEVIENICRELDIKMVGHQTYTDDLSGKMYTIPGLRSLLKTNGLLKNKHIPRQYLRGSIDQRLALLQGLMDTDGSWNPTRNEAVFSNTNIHLIEGVEEIVASLGWKFYRFRLDYDFDKADQPNVHSWNLMFVPNNEFNPFKLSRKASFVDNREPTFRSSWHYITSIEKIDSVATQCIEVDSEDSLFLAGRGMIPTHNTGKVPLPKYTSAKLMQLYIYAYAMYREGVDVSSAKLLYTTHREMIQVPIDSESIDKAEAYLQKAVDSLEEFYLQDDFPAKPGPLCGWCDHITRCSIGAQTIYQMADSGRMRRDAPAFAVLAAHEAMDDSDPFDGLS